MIVSEAKEGAPSEPLEIGLLLFQAVLVTNLPTLLTHYSYLLNFVLL